MWTIADGCGLMLVGVVINYYSYCDISDSRKENKRNRNPL